MIVYIVSGTDMGDITFVKGYTSKAVAEKEHRSYAKVAKTINAIDVVEFDRTAKGVIQALEYGANLVNQ
jgi:alkyl sulfatase BDS1-like metallo-beta-lactamase superfamily hydrolase